MQKTITSCDNCNKEYQKGNYGCEGVLKLGITYTDSMPERKVCKMDLCESCIQKVENAIQSVLINPMRFKDDGCGSY